MKVGEKKIVKYGLIAVLWLILVIVLPSDSYLHKVAMCIPSYFAVLFGSYAFLRIGFKLSSIPEFAGEQDKLREDIARAREFYAGKGIKL